MRLLKKCAGRPVEQKLYELSSRFIDGLRFLTADLRLLLPSSRSWRLVNSLCRAVDDGGGALSEGEVLVSSDSAPAESVCNRSRPGVSCRELALQPRRTACQPLNWLAYDFQNLLDLKLPGHPRLAELFVFWQVASADSFFQFLTVRAGTEQDDDAQTNV